MKLAHRGGVTRMLELIGCYALLGLLWFGYLDEWRVATLWLTLMLLAVSSLRVRRSLLENEPARNAWSGYAGQAGYHFLIAGWKVMVFLLAWALYKSSRLVLARKTFKASTLDQSLTLIGFGGWLHWSTVLFCIG